MALSRESLYFDGVNDFLQTNIMEEGSLHFTGKGAIAVHIAFRAPTNTDGVLFSLGHTGTGRTGVSLALTPGNVVGRITLLISCDDDDDEDCFIASTLTVYGGVIYNDGKVHTASLMFDEALSINQLRLIVDNVSFSLTTLPTRGMYADSNIITVGKQYGEGFFYHGDILEIIAQNISREVDRAIIYEYWNRKWCAVPVTTTAPPVTTTTTTPSP